MNIFVLIFILIVCLIIINYYIGKMENLSNLTYDNSIERFNTQMCPRENEKLTMKNSKCPSGCSFNNGQIDVCLNSFDLFRIKTKLFIPTHLSNPNDVVEDNNPNCPNWAKVGECKNNPNYMLRNCSKSCLSNPNDVVEDNNPNCPNWANVGECKNNPNYMLRNCSKSCLYNQNSVVEDNNPNCPVWAKAGECIKNPSYMLKNCKKTCTNL
jgi:hypothetical protein